MTFGTHGFATTPYGTSASGGTADTHLQAVSAGVTLGFSATVAKTAKSSGTFQVQLGFSAALELFGGTGAGPQPTQPTTWVADPAVDGIWVADSSVTGKGA